ncbi:hypothetical protein QA601_15505 [Chitinispirillales bacterium ANBcel5]|uniref:hypothetical protein n=1 Tax=Cellulosispirillum alkaliphilum TaxID=3039283 RepID=UPI002A592535|nr:hypothetical protein [Chitinispirillales bacterium ANBcel5]
MNENLSKLKRFLRVKRAQFLFGSLLCTLIIHLSVLFGLHALMALLFSFFPWVYTPLLWIGSIAVTFLSLFLSTAKKIVRCPSTLKIAKTLESKKEIEHPCLSLAVELADQRQNGSETLKGIVYGSAAEQIDCFQNVSVREKLRLKGIILLLLALLSTTLQAVLPQNLFEYYRLPYSMLVRDDDYTINPGTVTVAKNSSVDLRLIPGSVFPSASLHLSDLQEVAENPVLLRPDSTNEFSYVLDSLSQSIVYRFSLGRIPIQADTIHVAQPPRIRNLSVTVIPPDYTGAEKRTLPAGQGNFSAYIGSTVRFSIHSNTLKSAEMIFQSDTVQLDTEDSLATGEMVVQRSGTYTFALTDSFDQRNDSLPKFNISVIPDEEPLAFILKPGKNKDVSPQQIETLLVEGIDDLGISDMRLQWCRGSQCESPESWNLTEAGQPPVIRKKLQWDLDELSLHPNDTLFYWLRVRDNKPFGRPQVAISDTFWFRIPGFEEFHREIAEESEYSQDRLGQVREGQQNLSSTIEKLLQSQSSGDQPSWEQQRLFDDIEQQIKAQSDSLQKALESLKKSTEQLRSDGTINEQITEKMDAVEKAIEELIKDYGENLFGQTEDKQDLSFSDMKQAMDNVKELLPELGERLEQLLQFLENVRKEKELAALASVAQNLSSEQAQLAMDEQDSRSPERQKNLMDRIESMQEQLSERLDGDWGELATHSQNIEEFLEEMQSSLDEGAMPGESQMNSMSRELMSLSSQLSNMLQSDMEENLLKDYYTLMSMVQDALYLSDWQRKLLEKAVAPDDPSVAVAQQALINALNRSMTKIEDLSTLPPQVMNEIGSNYRGVQRALSSVITSLSNTDGATAMRRSVAVINKTTNDLLDLLSGFDDGSEGGSQGSGGMMAGMREISGQQAGLNSMMSDILNSLLQEGGEGSSAEQPGEGESASAEQARKEAQEAQRAIAEELKRLAEEFGKSEGEDVEKRVKELESEARRLAALLQNPPEDMLDQQDRFLSRLLQSSLSIHKRDEKDERRGNVAKNIYSDTELPSPKDLIQNPDTYYLLRRKALDDNYPEDYREAIRTYFDSLGEIFLNQQ